MRTLFICLIIIVSSYAVADDISAVLIPESMIGESMRKEVDWLIEDVDAPKSDFANAVAKQLKAIGVKSTVSATYENRSNLLELYSLEVYEFADTFALQESVKALKPGINGKFHAVDSQVSGFPAISIAAENPEIQILCIKVDKHLVVVGVVNDLADLRSFAQKYIDWFSRQSFHDQL